MLNTIDESADDFIVANVIKQLLTGAVGFPYTNFTRRLSARTVLGQTTFRFLLVTEMLLNFNEIDSQLI